MLKYTDLFREDQRDSLIKETLQGLYDLTSGKEKTADFQITLEYMLKVL